MKHILDDSFFRSKTKAFVIGKGPSLFRERVLEFVKENPDFMVIFINFIYLDCDHDFVFCNDLENAIFCHPFSKRTVCPMYPHWNETPEVRNLNYFYDRIFSKQLPHPYFSFDLHTSIKRVYENHPVFKAIVSTYESVFHALAYGGYREVLTMGIDGGNVYHNDFDNFRKDPTSSYDIQFKTENMLAEKFKISVNRLK